MKIRSMILIFMMCSLIIISMSSICACDNGNVTNTRDSNNILVDYAIDDSINNIDGNGSSAADSTDIGGGSSADSVVIDGSGSSAADSTDIGGGSSADSVVIDDADSIIKNMTNNVTKYNNEPIYNVNDSQSGFKDVQNLINDLPAGSVLYLNKDYAMQDSESSITISKGITLNGNGHTLNANGKGRIFVINGCDVVLNDLILTKGSATGNLKNGGAIYVQSTIGLVCENVQFIANSAALYGGAVYIETTFPGNFINCTFKDNKIVSDEYGRGGAIRSMGNLNINNCIFENNEASEFPDYGKGGAICADKTLDVINSTFNNNGGHRGGAIYSSGDCTIKNSEFNDNYAYFKNDMECLGGAIFSEKALLAIESCKFSKNNALQRGGAIYVSNALRLYGDNEFIGNDANDYGGAIYSKCDAYINWYDGASSSFNINRVNNHDGGAIYSEKNVYDENSCFTSNCADDYGGAVYAKAKVFIDSCNFSNNYAAHQGGAIYNKDDLTLFGYNNFIGNEAQDSGGAIYTARFAKNVTHAIFKNNKAGDDGGAVYINREDHSTFTECDFENNQARDEGGAIYSDDKDSSLNLYHNNFIKNNAKSGRTAYICGKYSLIKDNWHGSANPDFDNQFKEWRFIQSDKVYIPLAYLLSEYVWQ